MSVGSREDNEPLSSIILTYSWGVPCHAVESNIKVAEIMEGKTLTMKSS